MYCMAYKLEFASVILISMVWDCCDGNPHQRAGVTEDVLPRQGKPTLASHQRALTASVQTQQQATADYVSATITKD